MRPPLNASIVGQTRVSTFVCRVDDVFQISGRGCVVTPGIPKSADFELRIGDVLMLKRPDGSDLRTVLRGIEMGSGPQYPGRPLLLGSDVTKDQVPVGTEVWTA